MSNQLQELCRHNTWATTQVISFCAGIDPEALNWSAAGTYGTVLATLQHLVDAEASYVSRLLERERPTEWLAESNAGLEEIQKRADTLGGDLLQFVAAEWDTERLGTGRGDDGAEFAIRASIFLTQLIHHGNEHRAHICTILGAHGVDPPDVSAWGYAEPAGRAWVTSSDALG